MSVSEGNYGFDDGLWLFAILALFGFGGNGFGFGGNRSGQEPYATHADIDRSMQFSALREGQSNNAADIQRGIYEINSATKDAAYNNLSEIRDVQSTIANGFAQQAQNYCDMKTMVMENRYLDERNANNVANAIHSEGEATRALITQNETARLREELDVARNENSNMRQSNYILAQTGRWAANPPCPTCFGTCGN